MKYLRNFSGNSIFTANKGNVERPFVCYDASEPHYSNEVPPITFLIVDTKTYSLLYKKELSVGRTKELNTGWNSDFSVSLDNFKSYVNLRSYVIYDSGAEFSFFSTIRESDTARYNYLSNDLDSTALAMDITETLISQTGLTGLTPYIGKRLLTSSEDVHMVYSFTYDGVEYQTSSAEKLYTGVDDDSKSVYLSVSMMNKGYDEGEEFTCDITDAYGKVITPNVTLTAHVELTYVP